MVERYCVEGPYQAPDYYDPEGGRPYAEVDAPNARAAKVLAGRMPAFRDLMRDARGDRVNPYARMVAYGYPKHFPADAEAPTCLVVVGVDEHGDPVERMCVECEAREERIAARIRELDKRYGT